MRIAFASFFVAVSVSAQSGQIATTERPIILKIEAQAPKGPALPLVEYLNALSELAKALAWPAMFGIFVFTQRRSLGRLLDALVEIAQHSKHVKFGDMIDFEVDRSAKEAEASAEPPAEVAPKDIEAAARVGRMAESSDIETIRTRMLEFAREYEATRSNMKPGADRTRAMNAIVAKMRTLGIASLPLLHELAYDNSSPGKRLGALAILQLVPDLTYVNWVVERMNVEQPFLLFHASLVLLAMVRSFGARSEKILQPALKRSLEAVQSFSGGTPDRNTISTLERALAELTRQS